MAQYYHVAIGFVGKPVAIEVIQKTFEKGGWARYAPNCWIVFTSESPEAISERIRAVCSENDSIFVCELNLENRHGYLQKEIWEWLKS